jgi:hypothetical protein
MRRLLTLAILVLIGLTSVRAAAPPELPGKYLCSGTQGPDRYSVKMEIEAYDQTYVVKWINSNGDPVLAGLGISARGELAVAILSPSGAIGTAMYRLSPGELDGIWTRGDGKTDTEMCRKGDRVA